MRKSLRAKAIILIVLVTLAVGVTGIIVSSRFIRRIADEFYSDRANDIAHTMAATLDAEKTGVLTDKMLAIYETVDEKVSSDDWGSDAFNAYIANFSELEQTGEFQDLLRQLRSVQDVNDVDCLYISVLDAEDEVVDKRDGVDDTQVNFPAAGGNPNFIYIQDDEGGKTEEYHDGDCLESLRFGSG